MHDSAASALVKSELCFQVLICSKRFQRERGGHAAVSLSLRQRHYSGSGSNRRVCLRISTLRVPGIFPSTLTTRPRRAHGIPLIVDSLPRTSKSTLWRCSSGATGSQVSRRSPSCSSVRAVLIIVTAHARMHKRLLGDRQDGPFTLSARAWCVRGEVPKP
jgi:hypothetical protein